MKWGWYAPRIFALLIFLACFFLTFDFQLTMQKVVWDFGPQFYSIVPGFILALLFWWVLGRRFPKMLYSLDAILLALCLGISLFLGKFAGQIYLFANGKFDKAIPVSFTVAVVKTVRCRDSGRYRISAPCVVVDDWDSPGKTRTLGVTEQQFEKIQKSRSCFSGITGPGYFRLSWVYDGKFELCRVSRQ